MLIAEDDQDVRLLLYQMFKNHGYEVLTAKDGRDALRCMREDGLPDVLLADYNMPGMNGLELVKELHRHDKERRVKTIIATATHMRTSDDVRDVIGQVDLMLAKPFDYVKLVQLIDRMLEDSDG